MLKIKYKVLEYAKDLPLINYQTNGSSGLDLYSANISNIHLSHLIEYLYQQEFVCLFH